MNIILLKETVSFVHFAYGYYSTVLPLYISARPQCNNYASTSFVQKDLRAL